MVRKLKPNVVCWLFLTSYTDGLRKELASFPLETKWNRSFLTPFSEAVILLGENEWGFLGSASGKEPTCQCGRHETWLWSLGPEDPREEELATHSSIIAWKIPRTEDPGGLQSIGSQGVWHDWSDLNEVKLLSRVWLLVTPWTVAYHAPQSMGFSRQESWSGLPFSSPGNLLDPGIELRSPVL